MPTPDGFTEVGFWRTEKKSGPVPVPSNLPRINEGDLISALIVVEKHTIGNNRTTYRGMLACRICGKGLGTHVEYKSGDYKWRSDLRHYVQEHHIRQYPTHFGKYMIEKSAELTTSKKSKTIAAAKSTSKKQESTVEISLKMFSKLYWYLEDRSSRITAANGYPDLEEIRKYLNQVLKEKNLVLLLSDDSNDLDGPPKDKDSTTKLFKPTKKGLKIDDDDSDDDDDDDDDVLEDILPRKPEKMPKKLLNVGFFEDEDDLTKATIDWMVKEVKEQGLKLRCIEADAGTKKEKDDSMETLCLKCDHEAEPYEYTRDGFCWPSLLSHYMIEHKIITEEPRFDKWLTLFVLSPEAKKQQEINTMFAALGIDNKKKDEFAKLLKLLVSQ